MKNSVIASSRWVACAICLPAQPVIRGALNATSYAGGANGVCDIAQGRCSSFSVRAWGRRAWRR